MKLWVLSKKKAGLILVMIVGVLCLLCFGRSQAVTVAGTERDLPIYCVDKGEEKVISLSFDAAWGAEDTMTLIDILGKYDAKATFFVVGSWVDNYPEAVKALSDAGHEIMNHSDSHPHMTELSTEKVKEEVQRCNDKIESITGKKPHLFRPPYGDYNDKVVGTVRECGLYTIQWSVDSLDWKDLSASEIESRVISKTEPGSIVLFHNAAKNTPQALPGILENLKEKGYSFVPISELIFTENYTIDPSGKQISNTEQ